MTPDAPAQPRRIAVAAVAIGVHLLIGYALMAIYSDRVAAPVPVAMAIVAIPPAPSERIIPRTAATPKKSGKAAPPNRRAKAAAIIAPPPVLVVPPPPPPVAAAVVAGIGSEAEAGAAILPGPGSGAGGIGEGTGSGDTGDGDGDGGGTPSRWLRGEIRDADYPRAAIAAQASGSVGIRFTVGVKGRVTACAVTRSSGNAALDATTCRLIVERHRYRPARDREGRKIAEIYRGEHVWRYVGDDNRP